MPASICFVGHLMLPLLTGTDAPVVGGAEVQMFHLAEELHHRGWGTSFLVCALDDATPAVVSTRLGPATVLYRRRLHKTTMMQGREKLLTWRRVRDLAADIVFQRAQWDADLIAIAARSRRIPYVYALASDRDAVATPPLSRRRAQLRLATAIVSQSETQRAWVAKSTGRNATTIPSGFPLPDWDSTAPRDEILWVGTLRALKRPDVFLNLAAAFPAHRFVLCGGPGEDAALAAHVAARAATLPNVCFEGFVPYPRMATHFARARVLVNTSTYEGFPNTFVLAWLHRAAVVSLGVDPDGILATQGLGVVAPDPAALAAGLQRLLEDDAEHTALVDRARRYAEVEHDIERVATTYETLFAGLRRASGS